MLDPDKRYARHPDIAWRVIDGDGLLVDPRNGKIFPLNSVAIRIWQLLDSQHCIAAIVGVLTAEYDASPQVMREDAHAFIGQLIEAKLLIEAPEPQRTDAKE